MTQLTNNKLNFFDKERWNIFGKIYLANVQNRLREIENLNDVDCKRWVWELIQNAKDSIAGQKDRKDVDIKIIVDNNTYIFKHNGAPFNKKTLMGLLFKYSEGKANDSESTGRFGTGFLTTHTLSKTVKISGDIIIEKDGSIPQGFTVTIYREGEGDELLEGLRKTENSFEYPIESDGWTSFEYKTKTKRNKEAGRLGIENFKINITKTMLFCPQLRSVKLNDNGKILFIERSENEIDQNYGCQKLTLNIKDGENNFKRTFIYAKIDEHNNELSERFGDKRNLRINCAIELNNENNIFVDPDAPCLFCSLPLVGSENHELPFIINSPDFEPDTERQSLLLDGAITNIKSGKISDPGINKMILSKSIDLFKNIVNYICNNNIGRRHLLTRGLHSLSDIQHFDSSWYKDKFTNPIKEALINYPIVWNGQEYMTLANAYLPKIKSYEEIQDQQKAYNFISKVYHNKVPTFDQLDYFGENIFENNENINYVTTEDCVRIISSYNDMDSFKREIAIDWEWMDEFLSFINDTHQNYLKKYKIIPNMNKKFVELTNDIKTSKTVPENMIECLEELGDPWRSKHIHNDINKFTTGTEHTIDDAVSVIRSYLKTWSNKYFIIIPYIPNDCKNDRFIEKRNTIYELCSKAWSQDILARKNGNLFPEELWNGIDDKIFLKLIEVVQSNERLGGGDTFNFEYIKTFLECLTEYYPDFKNYKMVNFVKLMSYLKI